MDPEILRLEQVVRGGLRPRLPIVEFHVVAVSGGNVLIARAPRSFSLPHRVVRQGSTRFWARSNAGKYEPDVNELRSLFLAGPRLAERVQDFRLDRLSKLVSGHGPVQLIERGTLVLHIVPLAAFDTPTALSLQPIERDFRIFVPPGSNTASGTRINFEGVLKTSNADAQATQHRAYTLLYRNGIVEVVSSTLVNEKTQVISHLDDAIVTEVLRKLGDLVAIGVEPPYVIMVSLYGVLGAHLNFRRGLNARYLDELGYALDRDQYHPQEVLLETVPQDVQRCAVALKPILDQIANAGGAARSPIFDTQGNYIPIDRA
jgi:hypothetical protein